MVVALGDRLASPEVSGLGASGQAALIALSEYLSGRTIADLQAVVGLSHSGCVRLVDRLAEEGLVQREPSSDGRSVGLKPTRLGRARASEIQGARLGLLGAVLDELGPSERVELGELCGKVLAVLRRSGVSPFAICRFCDGDVCGHPDRCPVTLAGAGGA